MGRYEHRCAGWSGSEVNLAGVEGDLPLAGLDEQPPFAVDPGAVTVAAGPADRLARAARRARAPSSSTSSRTAATHRLELLEQARRASARARRARARACRRGRAARAGSPRRAAPTLSPIPSTAQRSCGRPSTRIPATLRPSTSTSLGHLTCASSPATSATADAGRERQQPRRLADHERAQQRPPRRRGPRRPWRPRPADCSLAVTSVPCGAPAPASSRARSLVESIRR